MLRALVLADALAHAQARAGVPRAGLTGGVRRRGLLEGVAAPLGRGDEVGERRGQHAGGCGQRVEGVVDIGGGPGVGVLRGPATETQVGQGVAADQGALRVPLDTGAGAHAHEDVLEQLDKGAREGVREGVAEAVKEAVEAVGVPCGGSDRLLGVGPEDGEGRVGGNGNEGGGAADHRVGLQARLREDGGRVPQELGLGQQVGGVRAGRDAGHCCADGGCGYGCGLGLSWAGVIYMGLLCFFLVYIAARIAGRQSESMVLV